MRTYLRLTAALFLSGIALHVHAATPVVVNFDDYATVNLAPMFNTPGGGVPAGAQLSTQYQAAAGVVFSSTLPYVAIGFFGSSSQPAGIGGVSSDGLLSYDDPVTVAFFLPGTSTPALTDSVSITGDPIIIPSQSATFSPFDANGNLLQSVTQFEQPSPNNVWTLTAPGIHSVTFSGGNQGQPFGGSTGIALDDLTFDPLSSTSPLLLGDANDDGRVDGADLTIVLNHFGATDSSRADGNFDGAPTIDLTDLSDVLNHFGATNPGAGTSTQSSVLSTQSSLPAPEPSSLLLTTTLAPLLLRRPRKS